MKADVDWSTAPYPWSEIGLEFRQSLADGIELERKQPSRITSWAKQLKAARVGAGLTQIAVADALHVHNNTVSEVERGVHGRHSHMWKRLADFYGITLSPP